jgi:hypothetical protein
MDAGALSTRAKRPGFEVNHSPSPSAEIKNYWSYISITRMILWRADGQHMMCVFEDVEENIWT